MGRVQQCTVRFSNTQGVERSTEVEAAFDSGPKDHPENEQDYADVIDHRWASTASYREETRLAARLNSA